MPDMDLAPDMESALQIIFELYERVECFVESNPACAPEDRNELVGRLVQATIILARARSESRG